MDLTYRIPQIDLAAVLKQKNPTIDIRVHAYEDSTRNFLKALMSYKNRAITSISERRKHQANEKKKALERIQLVETETNNCRMKELELLNQLEREKEERKHAELAVAAFKRQLATLRDKIAFVETDIEQYWVLKENLRREKNKERSILSSYSSHLSPDVRACEERLSCAIEGVEKDRLLVRFYRLDPVDEEKEASFVIDIATDTYKVITSSPTLPSMPILVNDLNETRDIYAFIRNVRAAYATLFDKDPR